MSGLRIKQYRNNNRLSQKALANILSVSTRSVARWEQNQTKPNSEELTKLSSLIGCSEEELLSVVEPEVNNVENSSQKLLDDISEGVGNLVTGQEILNTNVKECISRQDILINEFKKQNEQLLEKRNEESQMFETYRKEIQARDRYRQLIPLQILLSLVVVLILVSLSLAIWFLWRNNVFSNEIVEGSIVMDNPSYYGLDNSN